jgi:hypothetical protein
VPVREEVPELQQLVLDDQPLKLPDQSVTAAYALAMVVNSMAQWEGWRRNNCDAKWSAHLALYFGTLPQRTWAGSTVPRSSLPFPIVFDHVESALPVVMQALFPNDDWFQVVPETGTTPESAKDIRDKLFYDFTHARGKFRGSSQPEVGRAVKQLLQDGNGGVIVRWDEKNKRSVPEFLDIKKVYLDPGLDSPDASGSTAVVLQTKMTLAQVRAYRGQDGFDVPSDDQLYGLTDTNWQTAGDNTKQIQEAYRGVNFSPGSSDYNPIPADRSIEVLIYYSPSRIIWVMGRKWVMYNERNPYGFIPVAFAPCYEVPGRFYGLGIADVQEGNQRYTEALFNARLDNINLALNPPRAMRRGQILTPAQQRWSAGATYQVDNPKEDIFSLAPPDVTANVYAELQYIGAAAEKRTGIDGSGAPRSGNMSRTATGVQAQVQGSAARMQQIVSNVEDYLITPMLYMMYYINRYHLTPEDMVPAAESSTSPARTVSGAAFFNDVSFRIVAASKMLTKERLQQTLPMFFQYGLAGPLLGELSKVGMTVDVKSLTRLVQDATGTSEAYPLYREMTPEETQRQDQEKQQAAAQAQEGNNVRLQMTQMKVQGDLQKEVIKKQPDEASQQADMMKAQLDQQKAQMDMQMKAFELQMKERLAEIDIKSKQMKMAMDAQSAQMKLQHQQVESQQKIQQGSQEHQMKMELSKATADQTRFDSMLDAEVNRENMKQTGAAKVEQMKAQKAVSSSPGGGPVRKKAEVKPRAKKVE